MHTESTVSDFGRWKVWILQCIAVSNRFGVTPMPAAQLHVLLYLANTLATFFDVTPIRGRVLKRGSLPFYPDIQTEIDRLAFCGVLKIEQVVYGPKNYLAAFYNLGPSGKSIVVNFSSDKEIQKLVRLFEELVSASANRFKTSRVEIGKIDANYADNTISEGEVVDFSEWKNVNHNQAVAKYMLEHLAKLSPNFQRDGVRLYCDYLDEALAEHD